MTIQTFKSLKPRDFEQFLEYIFMEEEPENVGSKDTIDDNFQNWAEKLGGEDLQRYATQYGNLCMEKLISDWGWEI